MMPTISKQANYIPLSFIKGFASPTATFWIYDKKTDAIISLPKPANYIFSEWNKGNVMVGAPGHDVLKNAAYQHVDEIVVNCFGDIQNETVFSDNTDAWEEGVAKHILELKISENSKHKIVFGISAFLNFSAKEEKITKQHCKIIQSHRTSFILSDSPILYEQPPVDTSDSSFSIVFPLTEKRVYYEPKNSSHIFDDQINQHVNILLALQAKHYFASTDLPFLQEVIMAYKIMKPFEHDIDIIKTDLFQMIHA